MKGVSGPSHPQAEAIEALVDIIKEGIHAAKDVQINREREKTNRHRLDKQAEVMVTALHGHQQAFLSFMDKSFSSRDKIMDILNGLLNRPDVMANPEMTKFVVEQLVSLTKGDPMVGFNYLPALAASNLLEG